MNIAFTRLPLFCKQPAHCYLHGEDVASQMPKPLHTDPSLDLLQRVLKQGKIVRIAGHIFRLRLEFLQLVFQLLAKKVGRDRLCKKTFFFTYSGYIPHVNHCKLISWTEIEGTSPHVCRKFVAYCTEKRYGQQKVS